MALLLVATWLATNSVEPVRPTALLAKVDAARRPLPLFTICRVEEGEWAG
jgi:hypothetical protein